jgi:phosphopantothenoylcysteine synthetase/decarboxylase
MEENMGRKRRNGEGTWGTKTVNGHKYKFFRDANGKYTYGKTEKQVKEKLEKKNCDMLIANNLFVSGAGFQTDTNIVSLLTKDSIEHLPKLSKEELGQKILETMMKIEEGKAKC